MSFIGKIIFKINYYKNQFIENAYSIYAKRKLRHCKFTIICNNCFGGHIYETLKRPYNTPTVGLYIFAEDYIKFIENLEMYLNEDLKFIKKSRFKECHKEHNEKKYPIGLLSNNLEIHFLHYKTEEEAKSKWNRRRARIDKDNLLILMNDQNKFTDDLMIRFDAVDYPKVFFSSKVREGSNVKVIKYYNKKACVGDMYNDKLKCFKDFNLVSWIRAQSL